MHLPFARRILLCLRYGIGDLVMQLPVLDILRQTLPTAHLTALGAQPALQILEGDPRFNALASVQDWGLSHWGDRGTAASRRQIAAWLADQNFDLVIDPSHAVTAVGDVIWERSTTVLDTGRYTDQRTLENGCGGVAAIKEAVGQGWGLQIPYDLLPSLTLNRTELAFAADFLASRGMEGMAPVGLSRVASSELKRWPAERLAQVAEHLPRPLLFFRGPAQDGTAETDDHLPEGSIAVGPFHLRQTAALLARCSLFLCNDTGLMHLAAAVGTPVLAIFGPTSPRIYLPPGERAAAAGGMDDCPFRRQASFGPPDCLVQGHCMLGLRSCIDRVQNEEVLAILQRLTSAGQPLPAMSRP
jgi:ADP-heptose:LPS heptosyltransferase